MNECYIEYCIVIQEASLGEKVKPWRNCNYVRSVSFNILAYTSPESLQEVWHPGVVRAVSALFLPSVGHHPLTLLSSVCTKCYLQFIRAKWVVSLQELYQCIVLR